MVRKILHMTTRSFTTKTVRFLYIDIVFKFSDNQGAIRHLVIETRQKRKRK